MLRLLRLVLSDFRNYRALSWSPAARMVVVAGANGSGKTSLLEAISLLVPGRGLRGARNQELGRCDGPNDPPRPWAVAARIEGPAGEADLGVGLAEAGSERRAFRLNGAPLRQGAELASLAAIVWLTPQMDRLFGEPASGRRRFLDRLVWALEPGHAREVAAHEAAMGRRNRLLAGRPDPGWLAALEDGMARHAVAVAAARAGFVARLNAMPPGAFPAVRMRLLDPVADRLAAHPAAETEDWLRAALAANRARDAQAGSALIGAHRADMMLFDAEGRPASVASTGQQKAMLIGVVLAHAALVARARGFAPLMLLDEPAVHLDAARREALFAELAALPAQVFMTGTDAGTFSALRGVAEAVATDGGGLRPCGL